MSPARIEARGWGWRHGGRLAWAVRGLDLMIEPGERVLLLGASGSGKSTLLAALAGVLGDDQGEAEGRLLVAGAPPAAGRAGFVLQDPESQVILPRVGDDVAFGAENLGVPVHEIRARVPEALAAVGLRVPLDAAAGALSGGQKQRLALAGVMAMGPGLLLLDEPTANLDPDGVEAVRDAVVRAAGSSGATLIVVEHRVATWRDHVDRVVVLGPEGVLADGRARAVLDARGAELAAAGVWVPGLDPEVPVPAAPGEALIRARALVVGRDRAVAELGDVEIDGGLLTAVTGPNGVGKTTSALTLGGLIPPVAGRVGATPALAGGLAGDPIRWRSRDLLTRIAVVFQSPQHQFLAPTVRGELGVGLRALRVPEARRRTRVDELLDRLGLAALADANPFTLSGGQQRRLSVGSALAAAPRLVILDEPTFGQDARTWAALVTLLADVVAAGTGVVAVTHDPLLTRAAHRTIALGTGVAA